MHGFIHATAFQIHALYLHYFGCPIPPTLPYLEGMYRLREKLGEQKLKVAIENTANNKDLSYEQAGALLPLLDEWFSHPERFEEVSEIQADSQVLSINGKIYRRQTQ